MLIEEIELSSPDRIVYAEQGITKEQLARYYVGISRWMLPHMSHRPVSMVRCPQGQSSKCFYQKHWTHDFPRGVGAVDVKEEGGESKPYVFVKDVRGLVALVQYGVLEFHVWGARADKIERPDLVVFDLDPGPDVPWSRVVDIARDVHDVLATSGLESWVKTTGGKGLHVALPLARTVTWEDVYDFVRIVTAHMAALRPDDIIDVSTKAKRHGKVFLDYLRNTRGATAIAPWSTRAREGAPVSVPLSWKELDRVPSGDFMHLHEAVAFAKKRRTDPWADMRRSRQRLSERVLERLLQPS